MAWRLPLALARPEVSTSGRSCVRRQPGAKTACPIEEAEELVTLMLDEIPAQIIEINCAIEAIRAYHRFGKGRH